MKVTVIGGTGLIGSRVVATHACGIGEAGKPAASFSQGLAQASSKEKPPESSASHRLGRKH